MNNELRARYGDEQLAVIPTADIEILNGDGPFYPMSDVKIPVESLVAMPRYVVEEDTSYRQLIVYALVGVGEKYVVMRRIGGDKRLVDQHSIGIGGHVRAGESLIEALFREIYEEIGLTPDNIINLKCAGYIINGTEGVDAVHIGVVFVIDTKDDAEIANKEPNKHEMMFLDASAIRQLGNEGKLESWSGILASNVM